VASNLRFQEQYLNFDIDTNFEVKAALDPHSDLANRYSRFAHSSWMGLKLKTIDPDERLSEQSFNDVMALIHNTRE